MKLHGEQQWKMNWRMKSKKKRKQHECKSLRENDIWVDNEKKKLAAEKGRAQIKWNWIRKQKLNALPERSCLMMELSVRNLICEVYCIVVMILSGVADENRSSGRPFVIEIVCTQLYEWEKEEVDDHFFFIFYHFFANFQRFYSVDRLK